jgi:uncharacterized membrane protein YeaQ/YmgE (transglycosylase-associated protein family)
MLGQFSPETASQHHLNKTKRSTDPRARVRSQAQRTVSIVGYLIILFFAGLIIGSIARLLVPGPDPMGVGLTATIGLVGSMAGGLFSWYVLHRHGVGIVIAIVFSMILVWLFRKLHEAGQGRRTFGGPGGRQ